MAANSFFDFHFHPVFKQFITTFEDNYPTKRENKDICKEMDLTNDLLDVIDEVALHILQSQSCLTQIQNGGIRLGVANIASIEYGIADGEGLFGKILRSKLTRPLDQKYLQSIRKGELSYYKLFIKELDLFRALTKDKTLNFLSRKNQAAIKEDQYNVVLGMEGGHNLSRKKIGSMQPDSAASIEKTDPVYLDFINNPEVGPVQSLKNLQQALWESEMDLFCITLTHLTFIPEQFLATHAFGLKLIKHDAFYPKSNGLSQLGKDVIDTAYKMQVKNGNEKVATPIFIDIKHMSLKSRLDFYEYRKQQLYTSIPIIATHMGVTGYSINEWKDELNNAALLRKGEIQVAELFTHRKKAGEWGFINKSFSYNPWTINLMDEDITEIIESNGLIGMSLDVRILGFQAEIGMSSKDQSEYISVEDFKTLFPNQKLSGLAIESLEVAMLAESELLPTKEERHPLCLCFNILHIVSVGLLTTQKDPWKHICIGSDFDGLIDPVKICRDSSKMPNLERDILRWLPVAEKAYREQNGGPELIPRDKNGKANLEQLKLLVRGIMYSNGKNFIEMNWLKVSAITTEKIEKSIKKPV